MELSAYESVRSERFDCIVIRSSEHSGLNEKNKKCTQKKLSQGKDLILLYKGAGSYGNQTSMLSSSPLVLTSSRPPRQVVDADMKNVRVISFEKR